MLVWVEFAYLEPYSKKGYFSKVTRITNPKMSNPKSAPARVDWTKWETPIAVLANNIPGPAVFENLDNFELNKIKYNRE